MSSKYFRENKNKIFHILSTTILVSVVLVFCTHLIICQSFLKNFSHLAEICRFAVMESVLVWIVVILMYSISGSLCAASLLTATPYVILTVISYYKGVINGTPLLLGDFKMAGQFGEIAAFAMPQINISEYIWWAIAIALAVSGVCLWADVKVKTGTVRILTGTVSVLLTAVLIFTPIFTNWAVMIDDKDKFQEQRVSDYGPLMGLYTTYAQGKKAGEIYTVEAVQKIKNQLTDVMPALAEETKTPNVIFLMSESFFDIAKLENVEFKPDPIPNFHKIAKNFQSGDFITSAYCGGTGYVEMEVLTGICSNLLKEGDTLTYLDGKEVYKRIPAITDVFKNYGYKTVFLHSYNNQLYNRQEIYTDFGFDRVLFEDSFRSPEYKGGYISDMELAEKIIEIYKEKRDVPLFMYAVSMENHQPYTVGKFQKSAVKIKTDKLSGDELEIFDAYITGVADADKALGRLLRFFGSRKEPVMLVFFGDHMPNLMLSEKESVFTKLGYSDGADTTKWGTEQLKKMLSTDYVIWTNYKDKEYIDRVESSNFLGVSVLDRLGLNKTDYYTWLSDRVVPKMLMYRNRLFVNADGNEFPAVTDDAGEIIDDYAVAVYDIIYGENKIFNVNHLQSDNSKN